MRWRGKIKQAFLEDFEEKLICECMGLASITSKTVYVKELGRVGKSGARLLNCQTARGSPLVIKIHSKEKINAEYQSMKRVWDFFGREIHHRFRPPIRSGKGALLYWHQGGRKGGITELHDVVFRDSESKILNIFRKVCGLCEQTPRALTNVTLRREYSEPKNYMREDDAERVLSSILGVDSRDPEVTFLGTPICNPVWFVKQECFDNPYKVCRGTVHGDLHANNVIIDAQGDVHLIDFAWAHDNKHLLVDYVLMENSVRFLLF